MVLKKMVQVDWGRLIATERELGGNSHKALFEVI